MKKFAVLALTLTLLPSLAFARDARVTARERNTVNAGRSCAGLSARDGGLCIRDKQQNILSQRHAFLQSLALETRAWHLKYDTMGVSEEYQALLHSFLQDQRERRIAYDVSYRAALRELEAERRALVQDGASEDTDRPTSTRINRTVSTQKSDCFQGTRAQQRACIRNALYKNPALPSGQ